MQGVKIDCEIRVLGGGQAKFSGLQRRGEELFIREGDNDITSQSPCTLQFSKQAGFLEASRCPRKAVGTGAVTLIAHPQRSDPGGSQGRKQAFPGGG